jgi:hypothetical protein
MEQNEKDQQKINQEQSKLKRFEISFSYWDFGDHHVFPKKIIEAKTKEMAVYIYCLMFFASSTELEIIERGTSTDYATTTYKEFLNSGNLNKYWGLLVIEL